VKVLEPKVEEAKSLEVSLRKEATYQDGTKVTALVIL